MERIELQPIDAQTNGPQLFYGLRYHQHIVKPGEVEALHDQVGFWLWESATGTVLRTLSIPRVRSAMAMGKAAPDTRSFTHKAVRGSTVNGICSNPFLEHAFRTDRYAITITFHDDGIWSYVQQTTLIVRGQAAPFQHTDRSTLKKIGERAPIPCAWAVRSRAMPPSSRTAAARTTTTTARRIFPTWCPCCSPVAH
ncbi:MAG: FABP family protein [Flavobacteriales bacterium]|nr:FABP family protein [Flavobacteriales bacterium]